VDRDSSLASHPGYVSFTQASNIYRHPASLPCTQCLGVTVSLSLKVTRATPGGDQAPLLPLRGRPNIWTWVLTSLMGGAPLAGSCTSLGSIVHLRASPWFARRTSPSSRSSCLLVPGRITSPCDPGDAPQWQGRWRAPSPQSQMSLQKCYGKLKQRYRTLRLGSNTLLSQHRLSELMSKGLSPENKGLFASRYTLASRLQRQKK
jgi:hypothetical protein